MPARIASAIGFVDWNTAVIASGAATGSSRPAVVAQAALEHVERVLSDYLVETDEGTISCSTASLHRLAHENHGYAAVPGSGQGP